MEGVPSWASIIVSESIVDRTHGVDVQVPFRFQRSIVGERFENLRAICRQYSVAIRLPHPFLQLELLFVEGPQNNSQQAKEALLRRLRELQEASLREVRKLYIPSEHHSRIIGSCCAAVTRIREKHDVDIVFRYKEWVKYVYEIVLVGPEDQTEAANNDFLNIINELQKSTLQCVEIDYRLLPKLAGPRRMIFDKVNEYFNVVVRYYGRKPHCGIFVTGMRKNVEDAIKHLLMLATYFILGDQCGVGMVVPPPEPPIDPFYTYKCAERLAGDSEETKEALLKRVDKLQSEDGAEDRELLSHCERMQFVPSSHSRIVETMCAPITKIREKHNVDIVFRYKETGRRVHQIAILGSVHRTLAAMDEFVHMMQQLEESISKEVEIDSRVHDKLFGPGGKVVAKVNYRFNVEVRFPPDKMSNTITVVGMRKCVGDAIKHILMLADYFMLDVNERRAS